jgi:uncharacterized membrane protein YdjX (TVP38/TMEM64 family)
VTLSKRVESDAADSRRRRYATHPAALIAWGLFAAALLASSLLRLEQETVRAALAGLGPAAPLGFVLAEAAQVVFWPIPGQPLEIPGGWLFGFVGGTALGSVGAVAGSLVAFALGRRYGRPWVERHIPVGIRERFAARLGREQRAGWVVFWLMMVPSFPRDPLCYLAGLTHLTTARFALIALVGRPIGLAPWVALGGGGVEVGLKIQAIALAIPALVWACHRAYTRFPGRLAGNEGDGNTI